MTDVLLAIVHHTPTWVWGVLVLIVSMGARQLRTRNLSPQRVLLMPVLLGAFSLWGASSAFAAAGSVLVLSGWTAGVVLGWSSNRVLDLPRHVAANADGSFRVGGSAAPLVLMLAIFVARYANGAALAVRPGLATDLPYVAVATLAFAFPAGLLVARARKTWASRRGSAVAA